MNGHALFFFVRCGEGKEKFVNLPLDRACAEMGGKSARAHPFRHSSIRITPYTTLASVPNTMTGPATTNIFDAIPVMKPSLLKSMAGETTELAKPVIGTSVPAPAKRAMEL